jgi:hypothetical protein
MTYLETLVLRTPGDDGDYTYRMAKLPHAEAEQWRQRLASGDAPVNQLKLPKSFGPPMTLGETMELLDTRDFHVLDVPEYQFQ